MFVALLIPCLIAVLTCLFTVTLRSFKIGDRSCLVPFLIYIDGVEYELLQHPKNINELEMEIAKRMLNFNREIFVYSYVDIEGKVIEIRSNEEYSSFISYYKNPIFHSIELWVEERSKAKTPWKVTKVCSTYYDVVVVGSGATGLTAALTASLLEANLSVCIIEAEGQPGGDSIKASSGINSCATEAQKKKNVQDSPMDFFWDTIKSGQGDSNETLVKILTNQSTDAWDFLTCNGIDLSAVTQCGGHSKARTHRPERIPVGQAIVQGLTKQVKLRPNIKIITRTQAKGLIYKKGRVKGVIVSQEGKDLELKASSVILATGGFGHDFDGDNSLLQTYVPHLQHLPTTTGRQAVGSGIKMAQAIGAALLHMDHVQIHPTGFIDPTNPNARSKFLAPELLRGAGGVMINDSGKRFCNELGYRDYVSSQIIKCCQPRHEYPQTISIILLNEQCIKLFGPTIKFYIAKGFLNKYKNIEEVATALRVDAVGLRQTLREYSISAAKGRDEFNKTVFPVVFDENEEFYAGQITPVIHYTMGGLRIDNEASVLLKSGFDTFTKIPGLFAAGEVTGGVHGKNRLVGNSMLECIVFGRIAGDSAGKYVNHKLPPVDPSIC